MHRTLDPYSFLVLGEPAAASGWPDAIDMAGLRTQVAPTELEGSVDAASVDVAVAGELRRVVFPGEITIDGRPRFVPSGTEIGDHEVRLPNPWGLLVAAVDGVFRVNGPIATEVDVIGQTRHVASVSQRVWVEVNGREAFGATVPFRPPTPKPLSELEPKPARSWAGARRASTWASRTWKQGSPSATARCSWEASSDWEEPPHL